MFAHGHLHFSSEKLNEHNLDAISFEFASNSFEIDELVLLYLSRNLGVSYKTVAVSTEKNVMWRSDVCFFLCACGTGYSTAHKLGFLKSLKQIHCYGA